jgi:hypothetical protein
MTANKMTANKMTADKMMAYEMTRQDVDKDTKYDVCRQNDYKRDGC